MIARLDVACSVAFDAWLRGLHGGLDEKERGELATCIKKLEQVADRIRGETDT